MNSTERAVKKRLEDAGYTVYANGWPDFFAVRNGEFLAVEVKGDKDCRKLAQRRMHVLLEAVGVKVVTLRSESIVPSAQKLLTELGKMPIPGKPGRPYAYHVDRPATSAERTKRSKG